MIKYFLEDNGEDVWTLRDKVTRVEIVTLHVHDSEVKGYDKDWQDALEWYFEEYYGIAPDEWEIG